MGPSSLINFTLTADELYGLSVRAVAAKRRAYCPYSKFRVGAALLTQDGQYVQGANVEVASSPCGVCAERCAIQPLVASYDRPAMPQVRALAVSTDIWPPASPCGLCRQMIREFCEPDMRIYMYGRNTDQGQEYASDISPEKEVEICGNPVVMTIGELLPMSFGQSDMDKPR